MSNCRYRIKVSCECWTTRVNDPVSCRSNPVSIIPNLRDTIQKSLQVAVILFNVLISATKVQADPPLVSYIFPAGGQRGTQVEAYVGGCNLYESPKIFWSGSGVLSPATLRPAETIWFEGPVIPQPASQEREDYPRDYVASLVLTSDAALGNHAFRVATSQGATAAWGFVVGQLPEVVEREFEGSVPPVAVTLPVTINGRIFPREDVDEWSFSAIAGETVTCQIATSVFGSPLRARVAIFDPNGRLLAEAVPSGDVTPPVRFVIPETDQYRVRVHDIGFKGLQNHVYRLTITNGPVLDAVYPLGGRRGMATRFELDGVNLADVAIVLKLPTSGTAKLFHLESPSGTFGEVQLQVDEFDEFVESDSDDQREHNSRFTVPGILNGRIHTPGEEDVWRFTAQKGQEYEFDLHAARCGSPLDAVIRLCDVTGRLIQEVDDTPGILTDARLRWTATEDGEFQIRIRDRLISRGGRRFAYRVRATSSALPEFSLKLPADFVNVERGQFADIKVLVDRSPAFNEPVELSFEGMPAGLSIASPTVISANQQEIQIKLKAENDARVTTVPVRVTGLANIGDRVVKHTAVTLATSSGPDAVPIVDTDSALWVSTAVPTPFKYVGVFETKYMPRGGVFVRSYRIERNGFNGPLQAVLADRQVRHLQGLKARTVFIEPNQNEFEFGVALPSWMEIGRTCRSTISLSGVINDPDGTTHMVSYSSMDPPNQMVALIASGHLGLQLSRPTVVVRPGEELELFVRLQRGSQIKGPVTLELMVPKSIRGICASSVTVDPGEDQGRLLLEMKNELIGIGIHPLTIRATTYDERNLPVTAETKLTLVEHVGKPDASIGESK